MIYTGTWEYVTETSVEDPGVIDVEITWALLENALFDVKIRRREGDITASTETTRSDASGKIHYTIDFSVPEAT